MYFSWSYSHYSIALQCLQKFKYVAIDKLVPEGPQSSDLVFGSALHSAINAVLTGQDGQTTFEMYWDSYKEKDLEYGRFKWGELAKIGAEFIRKFLKYHAPKYKLEFAEQRLYADYKGVKLEGTLDYFGSYDGKSSLRDFKTSSRNYEPGKSETALQLYLYAYLYKQNFKSARIDTLAYVVFNKSTGSIQNLEWEFNEKYMYQHLDNLVTYVNIINDAKDFPKNTNSCFDFNKKCPYWELCYGN